MNKKNNKKAKSKSCSKKNNREKSCNKIFNKNLNEFLPSIQNEFKNDNINKSETNNFYSFNKNKVINNNNNNLFKDFSITPKLMIKTEDVRIISERLSTFKRPFNKNNKMAKLKRINSGNKIIKFNKNVDNFYIKESIDNSIKRKYELGNKTKQKEIKEKIKDNNLNNKEDEKYDKKDLLNERENFKQNIEKENALTNQKDQNEIKLLKEKLSQFEELKENQEKINLLKKDNTTREQSEIDEKEKYPYNTKNSCFEEIERKKFNQSMHLGNSRYPLEIYLENENDENQLLNFEDKLINRLINNKKENQLLSQKEKKAYPNIFELKDTKNYLDNLNGKKRVENIQKKKDGVISYFNNKTTTNAQENKDNDKNSKLGEKRGFFFDNKNVNKKNEKVTLKEYNCVSFKEFNSYEMDEKNDLNLVFNMENAKINDKKKKEHIGRLKMGNEKDKKLNDVLENSMKEKSESNVENVILKKESQKNNEELKLNEEEIERLKKEKSGLILKNKELNEENEKMKQKLKDNNNLILKNEELIKEKENIKEELEKKNNDLVNIKKENKELNNKINNLNTKNEELQKEKEEINNKLHKEKDEIYKELQKQKEENKRIDNLKLENKGLNEKLIEEMKKCNNLNNKNIELNNNYIKLNKENESIKFELNKNIEEKNYLTKEKDKLYEENAKNKILILQYIKEKDDLVSKKNELEKQLNELRLLFEQKRIQTNEIFMEILNKDPMILYKKPTLIGLNNIGATCFMNSTLQCLSQTKELTVYFLKQKNKNEIINNNKMNINYPLFFLN